MAEWLQTSLYLGALVSLGGYLLGLWLQRRFKSPLLMPVVISTVITIGVVLGLGLDYEAYNRSGQYLSWLLTPATVCLAVPLYKQLARLKGNTLAIVLGIVSGALANVACVAGLAALFGLSHTQYVTLLPKSVTTAVGLGISAEHGGFVTITAAVITMTGAFGYMIAGGLCRLAGIREPVARGVAIGTASHVIGTTRALEMGEVEGAMSSLATVVSSLVTVLLAGFAANLI